MTDAPMIFGKLIAVMRTVGAVDKSGLYDDKHGTKYNFRGVDAVVNAVAPAFREHGIIVMPTVLGVERETFDREMSGGRTGKQFRCIPLVQYTFYAEDGSSVAAIVEGESLDISDKGTAKALSVAYRVALLQCLNLPTDDPDPDTERPEVVSPQVEDNDVRATREALLETISDLPDADKELVKLECRNHKVPSLKNPGATHAQLDSLIDFIDGLMQRREPFDTSGGIPPEPKPDPSGKPFEPRRHNEHDDGDTPREAAARELLNAADESGSRRLARNSAAKADA